MVIIHIDKLSKIVQSITPWESGIQTIANKFLIRVVSEYGLPEYTMNDCNPRFYGSFWDEFVSLMDTTLMFSTLLHPPIDRRG